MTWWRPVAYILAALLASGCFGAGSGPTGTPLPAASLVVIVTNDELLPLHGADVSLTPSGTLVTGFEGTTGADGSIRFTKVPPGTHVVRVSAPLLDPYVRDVDVAANETTTHRAVLKDSPRAKGHYEFNEATLACPGHTQVPGSGSPPACQGNTTVQLDLYLRAAYFQFSWTPQEGYAAQGRVYVRVHPHAEDAWPAFELTAMGPSPLRVNLTEENLPAGFDTHAHDVTMGFVIERDGGVAVTDPREVTLVYDLAYLVPP